MNIQSRTKWANIFIKLLYCIAFSGGRHAIKRRPPRLRGLHFLFSVQGGQWLNVTSVPWERCVDQIMSGPAEYWTQAGWVMTQWTELWRCYLFWLRGSATISNFFLFLSFYDFSNVFLMSTCLIRRIDVKYWI